MSENYVNYSIQHKIEFVKLYYHKDNTFIDVVNVFHQNNPEVPKPHPSTVMRVIHKFEETRSVQNRKKKRSVVWLLLFETFEIQDPLSNENILFYARTKAIILDNWCKSMNNLTNRLN